MSDWVDEDHQYCEQCGDCIKCDPQHWCYFEHKEELDEQNN